MQTCVIAYVCRGTPHGQSIRCESQGEGRTRDARTQARHVEERLRQEGQEPQTGDCDRAVRGTSGRRQGAGAAQEEGRLEPQSSQEFAVEREFEDVGAPQEHVLRPPKEQQLVVAGPEESRLTAPGDLKKGLQDAVIGAAVRLA
jgi:hypothetical protein